MNRERYKFVGPWRTVLVTAFSETRSVHSASEKRFGCAQPSGKPRSSAGQVHQTNRSSKSNKEPMNRPDVKISEPPAHLRSLALACARVPLALALLPSCACMVVEQCTKCGVAGCPELFGQTSEWRDVIPNDELCGSCRDDVEWRKDNVLVPLPDQVVKAAHLGERNVLNRLADQGAPLSVALSGVENAELGCHLRLTAVAAVCLEFRDATSYREILRRLLCWNADSHTHKKVETPLGLVHALAEERETAGIGNGLLFGVGGLFFARKREK